jgi:hypothetical protein
MCILSELHAGDCAMVGVEEALVTGMILLAVGSYANT